MIRQILKKISINYGKGVLSTVIEDIFLWWKPRLEKVKNNMKFANTLIFNVNGC